MIVAFIVFSLNVFSPPADVIVKSTLPACSATDVSMDGMASAWVVWVG